VPIVPAAVLFDLAVGDQPHVRPTADSGYRAAQAATDGSVAEGNVGAGAGATVGKIAGFARAMKSGLGTASATLPDGLIVAALVAVNAVGDVLDPATGRLIAGVRAENGRSLADARTLLRTGGFKPLARSGENTTIGVVATNATLDKAQARKVAQMAHDGFARAIVPAHTPLDGDTIFALATGSLPRGADVMMIGALAADVMALAVVRAVRTAIGLPGLPAARDLGRAP
jgi:L-aminopeptidase/D-esterase-like protein